ncbi:MAG: MBL fold metallo-hydrolase [Pseudomonadota bacterium]|jgi:glyoxylase-like metal-dependent hydrolase (beta-lactamase superfamily II)
MAKLVLEQLMVGPLQSNCFILGDEVSGEAVIIDPGGDGDMILNAVRRRPWNVTAILNTHAHFDHIAANAAVKKGTGAPILAPKADSGYMEQAHISARIYGLEVDPSPSPDRLLEDGDTMDLGDEKITVASTPGHTPGGATFISSIGIFPGDALFAGSIGRTDLPGGDYDTLINSIRDRLMSLDDETPVYPGHGPATTVGQERDHNPFLVN